MKSNNLKEEKKVPYGIWTPNAKVLCYECHGDRFSKTKYNEVTKRFEDQVLSEEEFKNLKQDKELKEGYGITKCIKCRKDIQLAEEIAYENSLVEILKAAGLKAYMAQTGGMNSAAEISIKDDGYMLVKYDPYGDYEWLIEFFDNDGDYLEESYVMKDMESLLGYFSKIRERLA